ncbi:hypothetical protein B9Z55_017354 [Caenorhabditis nigoni]|uniref:Tc1-like transposase DDE domain-containing protein n=1 Tax=Caenorhabditis nigoni TaxID=1611254 RepID=A0A2G5T9N6_9PELO|nr:hypothetical protein B9Z55_017354 [Caenorhabditis nigoni]
MVAASPHRTSIIELFKRGTPVVDIAKKLHVHRKLVHRTIGRFCRTRNEKDLPRSGRPVSVTSHQVVRAVKERIRRNPERSMRRLATDFKMSEGSMRNIVKKRLGLTPYKITKGAFLTEKNKKLRLQKAKQLLRCTRLGTHMKTLFTDEKIFTVEANKNGQNHRILAKDIKSACQRGKILNRTSHPVSVMVFAGVTANGKTPLVFVDLGAKINKEYYIKRILEDEVLPWSQAHFGNQHWVFQQDGAPAHRAKITQEWCKTHFPDFIQAQNWPASSPDLNPMDYSVWGYLTQKVSTRNYPNLNSLKCALQKAWDEIDNNYLRAVVAAYPKRLRAVIKAKGGRIENC